MREATEGSELRPRSPAQAAWSCFIDTACCAVTTTTTTTATTTATQHDKIMLHARPSYSGRVCLAGGKRRGESTTEERGPRSSNSKGLPKLGQLLSLSLSLSLSPKLGHLLSLSLPHLHLRKNWALLLTCLFCLGSRRLRALVNTAHMTVNVGVQLFMDKCVNLRHVPNLFFRLFCSFLPRLLLLASYDPKRLACWTEKASDGLLCADVKHPALLV